MLKESLVCSEYIQPLSYIEPHEEQEAIEFVQKHLGFEPPKVPGSKMVVKVYVREEDVYQIKNSDGTPFLDRDGRPKFIALPESVSARDKFRSSIALVVSQGPDCYKGEQFKDSGPWCKVGDWIMFPRNEGTQINYRGIPVQIIEHNMIYGLVSDPSYVTRD